jgi:hypothetical protein
VTGDLTSIHDDAPYAREVLSTLTLQWPESAILLPTGLTHLADRVTDRDFVHTVQYLNDHGFISYDAMLLGVEPEPRVIGALITRRGQHLLGLIDKVGC